MLLKVPLYIFVPGVPEVPGVPAHEECPADPPPGYVPPPTGTGYWETRCETVSVFIGWDYGPPSFDNPGPFPRAIYSFAQVCRSVWVRTS